MNTGFNYEFWAILLLALFLLGWGIWLYLRLIKRSNPKLFYSNAIISWVLISLFPVVLLFSVFKDSSLTADFKDSSFGTIAVGGAFGAFFVIWFMGTRNTLKAIKEDHNEERVQALTEENQNLRDQIADLNARPQNTKPITESRKIEYELAGAGGKKILGVITGDIQQVRDVDLWVNSENTNLQMARFYDPSVSGLIRYLGAKKDAEGNVIEDIIANDLIATVKGYNAEGGARKDDFPSVKPGLAFTTKSGQLKDSHNVQAIIHVTTVFGEVGQGYTPIKNMSICVQKALSQADRFATDAKREKVSIVFPLFGTGTAKGDLGSVVQGLFHAALSYFETHKDSRVDKVYFLAWKEFEKEACLKILDEMTKRMTDFTPKNPS